LKNFRMHDRNLFGMTGTYATFAPIEFIEGDARVISRFYNYS